MKFLLKLLQLLIFILINKNDISKCSYEKVKILIELEGKILNLMKLINIRWPSR
jgi:hypothetical protein